MLRGRRSMNYLFYAFVVIAWIGVGVLLWGWINHLLETNLKIKRRDLGTKWLLLVLFAVCGPASLLSAFMVITSTDMVISRGLRFR
jgi:hypothetical protein